jgi:transposase InsO family protein
MAQKVASVDVRLVAAIADSSINVSAFCREHGISRETFYVWRRRYGAEGMAGLVPRSSATKTSPGRTPTAVEDTIIALRKELDEAGLDAGPATIHVHLVRRHAQAVPSIATIWRILVRRGFVTPQPRKRPQASWKRFEASTPNELWQADVTKWHIATGEVDILTFLDDHSRLVVGCRAVRSATTEVTWDVFCAASQRWGMPHGQLSDNGLNFSGRLRGFEVAFEINLRAAGVQPITSRPYHPQTCGKIERFHQTLKKWLRRQPLARTLRQLQAQLDRFIDYYNTQRPHRAINHHTPLERWSATPTITNSATPLPQRPRTLTITVDNQGKIQCRPWIIHVGVDYIGRTTTLHIDDTHAAIYIDNQLIRHLKLDHTRSYQPSHTKRGGPRRRLP